MKILETPVAKEKEINVTHIRIEEVKYCTNDIIVIGLIKKGGVKISAKRH